MAPTAKKEPKDKPTAQPAAETAAADAEAPEKAAPAAEVNTGAEVNTALTDKGGDGTAEGDRSNASPGGAEAAAAPPANATAQAPQGSVPPPGSTIQTEAPEKAAPAAEVNTGADTAAQSIPAGQSTDPGYDSDVDAVHVKATANLSLAVPREAIVAAMANADRLPEGKTAVEAINELPSTVQMVVDQEGWVPRTTEVQDCLNNGLLVITDPPEDDD